MHRRRHARLGACSCPTQCGSVYYALSRMSRWLPVLPVVLTCPHVSGFPVPVSHRGAMASHLRSGG